MEERKDSLYSRIRALEDWQKHLIIGDFLFDADEKQLEYIESEVESYERINKGLTRK